MNSVRKVLALALITFTAVAAPAQQKKPGAAPKVAVESFTHDFGEVEAGASLKFTFKVKNVGTADLLIQNVAPA